MAGAIFYGCLKPDQMNWILLPSGDRIKTKAGEWVYEGVGHEFKLLLRLVYAFFQSPHALPCGGGLLDQPHAFLEATRIFKQAESLYRSMADETRQTLKRLGGIKK